MCALAVPVAQQYDAMADWWRALRRAFKHALALSGAKAATHFANRAS